MYEQRREKPFCGTRYNTNWPTPTDENWNLKILDISKGGIVLSLLAQIRC